MPIIQKGSSNNIAASTSYPNLLSGEFFEFLPYNALIEVGLNASAVGILIDFISGTDVIAKDYVPLIKATSPIYPDEFTLQDIAAAGERLVLAARNTTGGALTLLYTVRISPI